MTIKAQEDTFFWGKGTLPSDSPSYVKRQADDELLELVQAGHFCYVLTARQMGKSSLMLRTAAHLREAETRSAIIDLSLWDTQQITSEQWYLMLVKRLAQELKLKVEPEQWWHSHNALTSVQRLTEFLQEIVLGEIEQPTKVVIFIDEIDTTRQLPFADDFYAAIRYIYNQRAVQPEYERLTFVLLGVAAPTDLIQDRNRTPFNIGRSIDLREFSLSEARPLLPGLERVYPGQGERLLQRIFYWTNGHPYLTQKLCLALAEAGNRVELVAQVDQLVEKLFLTEDPKKEDNLRFVYRYIEHNPYRRSLMQLYQQVHQGQTVTEDERSLLQQRLKLVGLVDAETRSLKVRNEIYRRVFNLAWIKQNMPVNWAQWITIGAVIISALTILIIFLFTNWQAQQTHQIKVDTYTDSFRRSIDADIRLNALAGLCQLEENPVAQDLFFALPEPQQRDIFDKVKVEGAGTNLKVVVQCLSSGWAANDPHHQALGKAMCCAMYRWDMAAGRQFSRQNEFECECEPAEMEGGHE